jgi:hypothetical protein
MTVRRPRGTTAPGGRLLHPVLALLAAALALTALALSTPAGASARHAFALNGESYVALGDSYTSGPAIPTQLSPTTAPSAPSTCLRSNENYPTLTAQALGLDLTDVSCGGATTADLTGPQGSGIPAQLSALGPSTSLVSVGIGGNDLGYSTIAANCAAYTPWGPTKVGWSCESHYTAGGVDQLAAATAAVGAKVSAVLADIRVRAEHARVFVIGYPDIVPPTGSGCWPALPFTSTDTAYLRHVEAGLNSALAAAAAGAGDVYVDMATPSASHSACTSDDTRWVEPIVPSPGSYPLHPDATGMAGMAQVLEAAMRVQTTV